MSRIAYAERIGDCKVLGPGTRAVIWVHGCCRDCPGCIAEAFRKGESRECTAEEMAEWVLAQNVEGLTISGGEPMLQSGQLADMIQKVREIRDIGVIVYTGYTYDELRALAGRDENVQKILAVIDLLIDGPYVQELDNNQPFVGSSNQRIIQLTDRYAEDMSYYSSAEGRKVEIRLSERRTLLAGVPGREQRIIWERINQINES